MLKCCALQLARRHLKIGDFQKQLLTAQLSPAHAGAMLLSRVKTIVWGTPDHRHGANGSWIDLFDKSHPTHTPIIRKDVLSLESSILMKDFFKLRRIEKMSDNWEIIFNTLQEIKKHQEKTLLEAGQKIIPNLTTDDP